MKTNQIFRYIVACMAIILSVLLQSGCSATNPESSQNGGIKEIQISPINSTVHLGVSAQFYATAIYADNTKQDVTNLVQWSTSNTSLATIGSNGILNPESAGSITVTAVLNGASGNTNVVISSSALQSIQLLSYNNPMSIGSNQQLLAIGIYADNILQNITNSAAWTSSNNSAVTVNDLGLATAVGPGSVTMTAKLESISATKSFATTLLPISKISAYPAYPSNYTNILNSTQLLLAVGTLSDGSTLDLTDSVAWSTSTSSTVSSSGVLTAKTIGTNIISSNFGGATGTLPLNITSATLESIQISLQGSPTTIPLGVPQIFSAIGTYSDGSTVDLTNSVVWNTSDASKVQIANDTYLYDSGTLTPIAVGSANVTAQLGSITSNSISVNVTGVTLQSIELLPSNTATLSANSTPQKFSAIGIYSDGSSQNITDNVVWQSTNLTVGFVSNDIYDHWFDIGYFYVVGAGTTQVTAAMGLITSSPTTVVVQSAIPTLASIQVSANNSNLFTGQQQSYIATGVYSDGSTQNITNQVTWSSSNSSVAQIATGAPSGLSGLATAILPGVTNITASSESITGTAALSVISNNLITSYSINGYTGIISESTITVNVPYGTSPTNLVASFTTNGASSISANNVPQVSGVTANNFSSPVIYTVNSPSGLSLNYTVTVNVGLNTAKAITSFQLAYSSSSIYPGDAYGSKGCSPVSSSGSLQSGTISGNAISVVIPNSKAQGNICSSLTGLIAVFATTGASVTVNGVAQISGMNANDFSSPVVYTVKAADGSTQTYTVSATIATLPGGNWAASCPAYFYPTNHTQGIEAGCYTGSTSATNYNSFAYATSSWTFQNNYGYLVCLTGSDSFHCANP